MGSNIESATKRSMSMFCRLTRFTGVSFQRRLESSVVPSMLKPEKSLGPNLRWGDIL
jgi:hypothetical protein